VIVLQQLSGQGRGRRVEFSRGPVLLGRSPDAELRFDAHADIDVSARHAVLELEGERWVIRDAGSRNGTFVGGKRIRERVLVDRDEIELGHGGPRLHVTLEGAAHPLEHADTEPGRSLFEAPSAASSEPETVAFSVEAETRVVSHEAETVVRSRGPGREGDGSGMRGEPAPDAEPATRREVPAPRSPREAPRSDSPEARLEASLKRTRLALWVATGLLIVALALLLTR
jgi:hypothetical protein